MTSHAAHHDDVPDGDTERPGGTGSLSARAFGRDRQSVLARERAEFGGIKIGSAFFGWLTATGTAVLLTALLAGAGAVVGVTTDTTVDEAGEAAAREAGTLGVVGAVLLLLVVLVAYYCGGYVAGRMARFDGAKQGLAVWLWALAVAIVVAIVGAIAGDQFSVLTDLNAFPRIDLDEMGTTGIVAALVVAAASLAGAVLGGIAGMRFHRKVDRAGLAS